ncbi:mastigoneme-like protein [Carpediemonas membranifera]|uniref:Mastigoneme-like protein n=1 Tax=Carpediemonas membranifera TaxID=201153 RepID=A0A8J6E8T0_9EUKA|nr:mastigoneme-like protein [Carpediemonas membranifera]|eukprot:KAG9392350.1 mastigoneme-like protein [Carpediemonas membranifera]
MQLPFLFVLLLLFSARVHSLSPQRSSELDASHSGAHFGSAIAYSNDLAAIGSPNYTDSESNSGLVTILVPSGPDWTETTALAPSPPTAEEYFGHEVAMIDSDLIVGAPGYSSSAGAAYLYSITMGAFTLSNVLADGTAGDRCGSSVALDGTRVVVGCPGASSDTGAVLLYRESNGGFQSVIPSPTATAGDLFGSSLAICTTLLFVGAPGANAGEGSVVSFSRTGWAFTVSQTVQDLAGEFGSAVTCTEDWMAAGAPMHASGVGGMAVYSIVTTPSSALTLDSMKTPAQLTPGAMFGSALSIIDTYLVAGAPGNASGVGGAVWFEFDSGWVEQDVLPANTSDTTAAAGTAVGVAPYSIIMGAPGVDTVLAVTAECSPDTFASSLDVADCASCSPTTPYSTTYAMTCTDQVVCDPGWFTTDGLTCEEAEAGYYVDPDDQTQQLACDDGSYQPETGHSSCARCEAGYFVEADGQPHVDQESCPAGTYQEDEGQAACIDAGIGYYVATVGVTAQVECESGKFQNETGQTSCYIAEAGYYVADSDHSEQKPCDGGSYQPATGQSTCETTEAGNYTPADSQPHAAQLVCDSGKFQASEGQAACDTADAGYHVPADGDAHTVQVVCDNGHYQPAQGQASCVESDVGYFVPDDGQPHTAQTACDSGKFAVAGSSSCAASQKGFRTSPDGSTQIPCNDGKYQPEAGQDVCLVAEAGFFVPADGLPHETQTACSAGYFSSAGSETCSEANPGYYIKPIDQTQEFPCHNGQYQPNPGQASCLAADPDYYVPNDGTGHIAQTPCPVGTHSPSKAAQCIVMNCAQGQELILGVCTDCGSGEWAPFAGSCREASEGYYVDDGDHSQQLPCNGGEYSDDTGLSQCKLAPPGFYTPPTGAITEPIRCPTGSYAASGQSACTVSGAGYYVNNGDRTHQIPCNSGKYQPDEGETHCIGTPPGTFTGPTGPHAAPIDCGAGEWAGEGQDHCSTADPGYYVPDDDRSAQLACDDGSFSNTTGSTECTACPAGYSTPGDGQPHTACSKATVDPVDSTSVVTLNDSSLPAAVSTVTVEGVAAATIPTDSNTHIVLVTSNSTVSAGTYKALVTMTNGKSVEVEVTVDSDYTIPAPSNVIDGAALSARASSVICPTTMATPLGALAFDSAYYDSSSQVVCKSAPATIDHTVIATQFPPSVRSGSGLSLGYNRVCVGLSGAVFGSTDLLSLSVGGVDLSLEVDDGAVCGSFVPGMPASMAAADSATAFRTVLSFDGNSILSTDLTLADSTLTPTALTVDDLLAQYQTTIIVGLVVGLSLVVTVTAACVASVTINVFSCLCCILPRPVTALKRRHRGKMRVIPISEYLASKEEVSPEDSSTASDVSSDTERPMAATPSLVKMSTVSLMNDCVMMDPSDSDQSIAQSESGTTGRDVEMVTSKSVSAVRKAAVHTPPIIIDRADEPSACSSPLRTPSPSPTAPLRNDSTHSSVAVNASASTLLNSSRGTRRSSNNLRMATVQMAMAEIRRSRLARSGNLS